MRAGDLDRRVTLQQPVPARDATGEETHTWSTVGQVWAKVEGLGGAEDFRADKREHDLRAKFTIRYRPGINSMWRIIHDGDVYQITDVTAPDRRETLELLAFSRAPASGPGGS